MITVIARSCVRQPYQMVKDLRTGVEVGNPRSVLDGDLDRFLEAALAQRLEGGLASASRWTVQGKVVGLHV